MHQWLWGIVAMATILLHTPLRRRYVFACCSILVYPQLKGALHEASPCFSPLSVLVTPSRTFRARVLSTPLPRRFRRYSFYLGMSGFKRASFRWPPLGCSSSRSPGPRTRSDCLRAANILPAAPFQQKKKKKKTALKRRQACNWWNIIIPLNCLKTEPENVFRMERYHWRVNREEYLVRSRK